MTVRPSRVPPLAALAAYPVLLLLVLTRWPPLVAVDVATSAAARSFGLDRPGLVAFLRVATAAGDTVPYVLTAAVAAGVLAARRAWPAAVFWVAVGSVVPVLWAVHHALVYRPRPVEGFVVLTTNGFPSGHSTNAAALASAVVLSLWPRLGGRGRCVAVLLGVAFTGWVGLTRVLLLAHWPSDVLGGWLLALGVVGLLYRLLPTGRAVSADGADPPDPVTLRGRL